MRTIIARTILLSLLLLTAIGQTSTQGGSPQIEPVLIESASGAHMFQVELAVTPEERAAGLMFRRALPTDGGMLFLYGGETRVSMWMKNTLIPLDMIFIGREGRIVKVAMRAVPQSEAVIASGEPVVAVLEINGGLAEKLGIAPGDRVRHPLLAPLE